VKEFGAEGRQRYLRSFTNAIVLEGKGNKLLHVKGMVRTFSSPVVDVKRCRCKTSPISLPTLCNKQNFLIPTLSKRGKFSAFP